MPTFSTATQLSRDGSGYALPRSAAGISAVVSFVLVLPATADMFTSGAQVAAGVVAVLLSSVTALWCYARERRVAWSAIWMTPPGLLWISFLIVFGLSSYYWIAPPTEPVFFEVGHIAVALSMVVLFIWTSLVGLFLVSPRLARWSPLDQFDGLRERFDHAGAVAFGAGLLASAALIVMGRFAYAGDPSLNLVERSSLVNLLNLASPLALFGAAIVLWNSLVDRSAIRSVVGYSMFATLVIVGLLSGFKGAAIVPAMAVIIIYRIARGRYPKHLLIGAAIGVVLVFPFNTTYRTEVRYIGTDPVDALSVAVRGVALDSATDPLGVVSNTAERLTGRLRLIDSPAAVVARTPTDVAYLDAFDLPTEIAARLIPRSIWQGKPVADEGYRFGLQFFSLHPESFTSIATTVPGSAFRYGGASAVIVFGLLAGAYFGVLERAANPVVAPAGLFLFMTVVRPFTALESAIVPLIASQIQVGVVGILAIFVLLRRTPRGVRPMDR